MIAWSLVLSGEWLIVLCEAEEARQPQAEAA